MGKKIIIEKELLIGLYYGLDYSLNDIANLFGVTKKSIYNKMIIYNIPRRTLKESKFVMNTIIDWNNPKEVREYKQQWKLNNPDKVKKSNEKGKERNKIKCREYYQKYKEEIKEKNKEWANNNRKKSNKIKYKYNKTKKGVINSKKCYAKRHRNLKFIQLFENPFPEEVEVDYHHINNVIVIPIPSRLHELTSCGDTDKHKKMCKDIILNLYGLDVELILEMSY